MNEVTLPPSPNWYLSTILTSAQDGTLAWGSKNAIVIAKHQEDTKILSYSIISDAHLYKVNSLAFSPEYGTPGKNLLVSGGDEYIIRIWNLDTMSASSSQSFVDTKQKVIGVDWSKADTTLVCGVTSEGSLMAWNTPYNACKTINLGKMTATCIACCPHQSNVVAVGTKSGLIYIVNLQGNGTVTYKLRGHDVDITSLSWCPSDMNVLSEKPTADLLLASGAKDKSIFIWKAGGDGRYETQLALPHHPLDSHQHKTKLNSSVGVFTVLCWVESRYLLATSLYGELLAVDLCVGMKNPTWKLLHGQHSRGLFVIANVPILATEKEENWRINRKLKVWTTAQDRQIICNNIERDVCTIEYSIPTQAGFIYCIAACPLDTSRIAFGAGDALLRLWNLSEPHECTFDIVTLWQKIMGRVTAIAWHPEQENILAFGTGEGRIGVFDTNAVNKPPVLYRPHHRRTVYTLGWGPIPGRKGYALYSCGDNELIYYNPEKTSAPPTVFIKKDCTEFSWKPDFSCLAVGFEDGSIVFYNKDLKSCGKPIFTLKKTIQCLAWHPNSTTTDLSLSPMRNYLAIASNATSIAIFDMSAMIAQSKDNTITSDAVTAATNGVKESVDNQLNYTLVATLCGHIDKVVSLAWSPHFSGQIVSASMDHTAQVWKVDTQELIATYTGHTAGIYSCMWSPIDNDLIITGSADFSLRIWKVSNQKVVIPVEKVKSKKKTKKTKGKKCPIDACEAESSVDSVPSSVNTNEDNENGKEVSDKVIKMEKETVCKEKKTKKSPFLSAYRKTMNNKQLLLSSCLKLARNSVKKDENAAMSPEDNEILSIFGSKEDVSKIITADAEIHQKQGQHTFATELSLWNGNLRQQLQDAASEHRLNDYLMALAPSLSVKMWQEMCETYAAQLVAAGNPAKAVSYLLCVHKIHQAIDIFRNSRMFREAYCLAKCKLDPSDAIFNTILEDWNKYAISSGFFEDAAQCCIQLGELGKAAKLLARRKDIDCLETAAEIADLTNDRELCEAIADEALLASLVEMNYQKARELIGKFPCIKYRWIHCETLEEMKKMSQTCMTDDHCQMWLDGKSQVNLIEVLRLRFKDCDSLGAYKKLSAIVHNNIPDSVSLYLLVSQQIALAAASEENQMRHTVSALGLISQYEILNPTDKTNYSIFLLSILGPLDAIIAESQLNTVVCKSYRAFTCLALLNWIVGKYEEAPDDSTTLNNVTKYIENTLIDGLDKEAVKYWTATTEISKIEATLAANMTNGHKNHDEDDEKISKSKNDPDKLLKQLDNIRKDKENFIAARICAPSPILLYSKATQLLNILSNEEIKDKFTKTVAEAWKAAVS